MESLDHESLEARAAFLDGACRGDTALRGRLDAMLSDHFDAAGFMATPAAGEAPSRPAEEPANERPGDRISHYKLLQNIGEGGCGVVYMAEQSEPVKRRVALKVIKLGMDTKNVIARFEAERQALAMMDHPNIAKVLDAGATEAGRPYFVMELVRGVKITEYCDEARLSTRERLDLFIKVCHAIQHAHQKGIIHRDIKPSNILVTVNDGVPVPKVIDFGIAKATNQQQLTDQSIFTAFEQFIGTPAYMSPEQAVMTSLDIDTRSDIYSLGVLLYEMLTGKTPFESKDLLASGLDEMRRTIREQEPVRPSTRLSTMVEGELSTTAKRRQSEALRLIHLLRGDVDWIVMKCLEKNRARRYETAIGLAKDIQRHLNHEAVLARPPSAAYRVQKLVRRNRLAFAAAVAVTTALLLGLATSSWQMILARRARTGEQQQRLEAQAAQRTAETERERADAQASQASQSQRRSSRLLYASDMNLAQQALKVNNIGKARRLLDRHRRQPGEEDLRGWEWRYLWQLTRNGALVTLTNRPTRGSAVSFSPDGSRLAVGWLGGRVDLWDVPNRRWFRSLADHDYAHSHGRAVFSPVRNLLAATSEPGEVSVYDLDSGRQSTLWSAPEKGWLWDVKDISFSKDGSRLVIYAGSVKKAGDAVWVVNVSTSAIEGRYPTAWSNSELHGAARLSLDNRRLYLARSDSENYRYSIRCLDVATGVEVWETDRERDYGLTAMALSPDGRVLASGSGFEDPTIRIWDARTGRLLDRLPGHTGWVCKLTFTQDGLRLVSAASDQSLRFWDTNTWIESRVLRGHVDEVHAVAISETARLAASAGKDGNIMLWTEDGKSAVDGYHSLPGKLRAQDVLPMDDSRVLLLPAGDKARLVDLKRDSQPVPLREIESYTNAIGSFGSNSLCLWRESHQVVVLESRGTGFAELGTIALNSRVRPLEAAYSPAGQLLAWSEGTAATSILLARLAAPDLRTELKGDVAWLEAFQFSDDGSYLAATAAHDHSLRAWNTKTGLSVVSINERARAVAFAAGGRILVAAIEKGSDHEIGFFDLDRPGQEPRRVRGKDYALSLAVSPDGGLVASATAGGEVRFFDPSKGILLESVHGHLNGASCVAFSPDGQRLMSTSGGKEAVKLWNVGTRQELLTLGGVGSMLESARWSADGNVILGGPPWQAWRAPSWEEIAAVEAKEKPENRNP